MGRSDELYAGLCGIGIFPRRQQVPAGDGPYEDGKDAVKFALGFEKETLLYFWELRSLVKEKEIVDEVINEEKSHIMWLDTFKRGLARKIAADQQNQKRHVLS